MPPAAHGGLLLRRVQRGRAPLIDLPVSVEGQHGKDVFKVCLRLKRGVAGLHVGCTANHGHGRQDCCCLVVQRLEISRPLGCIVLIQFRARAILLEPAKGVASVPIKHLRGCHAQSARALSSDYAGDLHHRQPPRQRAAQCPVEGANIKLARHGGNAGFRACVTWMRTPAANGRPRDHGGAQRGAESGVFPEGEFAKADPH